jgi:hypothetical protein
VFVTNNGRQPAAVRILPLGFRWKIQQAKKGAWDEVLTGGIGGGVPSTGTKPLADVGTCTIDSRKGLLVGDFDLRRDDPEEGLKARTEYRITFTQEVDFINSSGGIKRCKLVARPQVFRL